MASSFQDYEDSIKNKLSLKITYLSKEEESEFTRILNNDLKPFWKEEVEKARTTNKSVKRKVKIPFEDNGLYHNKYGLDYKRKEDSFFVLGINECFQELKNDNLRILLYNKIGVRFCLGEPLLLMALNNNIPIIPLKVDQCELSTTFSNSKKKSFRTTCIGITKKTPSSRSLLSSLVYLEKHYSNSPHVSFQYPCASWNQEKPVEGESKPSIHKKQGHVDREGKRHIPVYSKCSVDTWMKDKANVNWIASLPRRQKKSSITEVETIEPQKVEKNTKAEVPVIEKKSIVVEKKKEVEEKKTPVPKPKQSLKDRLKKNVLFRFKYLVCNKHMIHPSLCICYLSKDIHL